MEESESTEHHEPNGSDLNGSICDKQWWLITTRSPAQGEPVQFISQGLAFPVLLQSVPLKQYADHTHTADHQQHHSQQAEKHRGFRLQNALVKT